MKRLGLLLLVTLLVSSGAWAQKGVSSIGLFLAGQYHKKWLERVRGGEPEARFGMGLGARYQYYLSNHFRVESALSFYIPTEGEGVWTWSPYNSPYHFDYPTTIERNGRTYYSYSSYARGRNGQSRYRDKNAYQYLLNVNMHYVIGNFRVVRPYVQIGLFAGGALSESDTHETADAESKEVTYSPSNSPITETYFYDAIDEIEHLKKTAFIAGVNAGLGVDVRLTSKLTLQLDCKVAVPSDFDFDVIGVFANLGVAYNF